jgi:Flp pilus assembly protein TadD
MPEAEHAFRAAGRSGYAGLAAVQLSRGRIWQALALRVGLGAGMTSRSTPAYVIAQDAADVDRLLQQAGELSRLGRVDEAAAAAEAALRFDPASAPVLAAVSATLHPWNDAAAERCAREAIAIDPGLEAGHTNLSAALWGQGKLEEAEKHCREAIRLAPDATVNRLNLALILRHAGRLDESAAIYRELEEAIPGDARLCTEYANLLVESGEFEQARALLRRAEGVRPRLFEATLDLLQGNYAQGWDRYEARKQGHEHRWHARFEAIPEWTGEPLGDRTLLVYGEQSLGDEIMFASMLADVLRRASRVTLLCGDRLGPLFTRSFSAVEVVPLPLEEHARWLGSRPPFGCAIAAGSLGRLFRRQAADFPRHAGYLVADQARVAAWRERLAATPARLRIGVSWRGGTQGTGLSRRSVPLAALEPELRQPGVHWVSLQHGEASVTQDLDELAALAKSLDLVISVCNTNVHVCGAIGKEVWVMAPLVPEWRYGASGEGMAWYPSARVLRQERHGDWSGVLQEIGRRLRERAQGS